MIASDDDDPVQLLHILGHLYSQHGQTRRGVVLLLIAARLAPKNVDVWRTLAHAFLAGGAPDRAIVAIGRLRQMSSSDDPALDLLMSRALWASGRRIEARRSFRDFLERSSNRP
jgi:predicted Zn-dependent protease